MSREQSNPLPAQQLSAPNYQLNNSLHQSFIYKTHVLPPLSSGDALRKNRIRAEMLVGWSTRFAVATDAYSLLERHQLRLDPRCHRPAYTSHNSGGIANVYRLTSHDSSGIAYVIERIRVMI